MNAQVYLVSMYLCTLIIYLWFTAALSGVTWLKNKNIDFRLAIDPN